MVSFHWTKLWVDHISVLYCHVGLPVSCFVLPHCHEWRKWLYNTRWMAQGYPRKSPDQPRSGAHGILREKRRIRTTVELSLRRTEKEVKNECEWVLHPYLNGHGWTFENSTISWIGINKHRKCFGKGLQEDLTFWEENVSSPKCKYCTPCQNSRWCLDSPLLEYQKCQGASLSRIPPFSHRVVITTGDVDISWNGQLKTEM